MKICVIVLCILLSNVHCILEFHTHVHRHLRPSNKKTDLRGYKGHVDVSNIPSAGDGALNPWFYRFPPWTEHNPPPPTLALTNGDALKSPQNIRDISSLRRAPHDEERFVFHDVKVDLDMPYVNEVVKTVLATQGQSREDDHLVYGEEIDKGSFYPPSNVRQQNGLLNSYDENSIISPNYPTKPSFGDRTSTDIVFLKTNDIFPLYEVYGKSKLDSKYVKQPEDFSFPEDRSLNSHQQDSFSINSFGSVPLMFNDNSIDSTQMLFPKNQLSGKINDKTKNTRHVEEFGQTPRELNSRLKSSLKDGSKYPTSIQDIINEQKPSQSSEFGYEIDPRHNRPSRQTRLSRRSRFLGSRWVWSDGPDR